MRVYLIFLVVNQGFRSYLIIFIVIRVFFISVIASHVLMARQFQFLVGWTSVQRGVRYASDVGDGRCYFFVIAPD